MADTQGFRVHVDDPPPLPLPRKLEATARSVAASRACVLLAGERGTGKTVLAQKIHEWSRRSEGPFVRVDLASLPLELIHSELFGHTQGAFTGAGKSRKGPIRRADQGTAFLDEISALPSETQGTLLTLFQERRVRPVGSDRSVAVDVRLVCATNQDLRHMVGAGRFRPDLYDRCTRAVLPMPPLRERRDDLWAIARRVFWTVLHNEGPQGLRSAVVTSDALAPLASYPFPGNIRELASIAYGALQRVEDGVVDPAHIRAALQERKRIGLEGPHAPLAPAASTGPSKYRCTSTPAEERAAILRALARAGGVKQRAATDLGMSRRTLYRKLDYYAILEEEWQESDH